MTEAEELKERLDRVRAIINVMEQHGEVDLTILTQLKIAVDGELYGGDEDE